MLKPLSSFTLGVLLLASPTLVQAPEPPPGPIYIVQEGDTLWDIAVLFNVSITDLIEYNQLTTQDIYVGDELVIPGLEKLTGTLSLRPVQFGETLQCLSRQGGIETTTLISLNRIVSPAELFVGYKLILLQKEDRSTPSWASPGLGESIFEFAIRTKASHWKVMLQNQFTSPAKFIPGDLLITTSEYPRISQSGVLSLIHSVEIDPLPIAQGDTVEIWVNSKGKYLPEGSFIDNNLHFFQLDDGSFVALQGVDAMLDPGIYPIQLAARLPDGSLQTFEQMILVESGNFLSETLYVDNSLIDPALMEPENEWLFTLTAPVTPEKLWSGIFQLPVASDSYCLRSGFGNRRAYNDGSFYSFHTGVDFGICSESHPYDIYAPAAGLVVFTGSKAVRGNATIINHGWGVYSGFWHQDEIFVTIGEHVAAGDLIGLMGATGRVTGPHLHWEVWVAGFQVDPLQWLDKPFPNK